MDFELSRVVREACWSTLTTRITGRGSEMINVSAETVAGMVPAHQYRLGPQIPLFDAETVEVSSEKVGNADIVYLGSKGFEFTTPLFWWLWDYTIGFLLGWWIQVKSRFVIARALRKRITAADSIENIAEREKELKKCKLRLKALMFPWTRKPVLDWARRNFGYKALKELFSMKTLLLNGNSPLMQHFCQNAENSPALDDVYNALASFSWQPGTVLVPLSFQTDPLGFFHNSQPGGQAVRNRYRIVARLHHRLLRGKILSVACGSAQPLIHALRERVTSGATHSDISVLLADVDSEAIKLAFRRAEQAGVRGKMIELVTQFALLEKALHDTRCDHIECCGMLDYLPDERVVELLKFFHSSLEPGGTAVLSMMNETRAARVLSETYNWWIIYRTPEQFVELLRQAGFNSSTVYIEPWRVHMVALVRK